MVSMFRMIASASSARPALAAATMAALAHTGTHTNTRTTPRAERKPREEHKKGGLGQGWGGRGGRVVNFFFDLFYPVQVFTIRSSRLSSKFCCCSRCTVMGTTSAFTACAVILSSVRNPPPSAPPPPPPPPPNGCSSAHTGSLTRRRVKRQAGRQVSAPPLVPPESFLPQGGADALFASRKSRRMKRSDGFFLTSLSWRRFHPAALLLTEGAARDTTGRTAIARRNKRETKRS